MIQLKLKHNTKELEKMFRRFPEKFTEAVVMGLNRAASIVAAAAQDNLKKPTQKGFSGRIGPSVASGQLTQAMGGGWKVDEDKLEATIGPAQGAKATATGGVGYGWFVEHGRAPGKAPPPDVLRQWIRRKLGLDPEDVEFLIRRAIARRGTRPAPFLEPALKANISEMADAIDDAIAFVVRRENDKE